MKVLALSFALVLAGCGLFGDDPPRADRDASDTTPGDTDADGETGPAGEGMLSGAWPQASIGRPGGVRPAVLGENWRLVDSAVPGTDTGFIAIPCTEPCDGTCGLAYELPDDRRIIDLQVATGPDGEAFLNVVEGPDAWHMEDPRGARSRLLRVIAPAAPAGTPASGSEADPGRTSSASGLLGRDALAPDLADAARRVGLEGGGEVAFIARDLFHVAHPDGPALVAVGHLFQDLGNGWAVRDVALGLDPLTGRES
jgi:hypothetical protein